MTPLDLTTLAADCEARAAAGEKPAHPGWKPSIWRPFFNCQSTIILLDKCVCECRNKRGGPTSWIVSDRDSWDDGDRREFTMQEAAQLFAEALLARATAQLHAPRLRPMSEAPRDGRAILAFSKRHQAWEMILRGITWTREWAEHHYDGWLPLPDAPENNNHTK